MERMRLAAEEAKKAAQTYAADATATFANPQQGAAAEGSPVVRIEPEPC
jgi:hypothetical protein